MENGVTVKWSEETLKLNNLESEDSLWKFHSLRDVCLRQL